jgi:hypothetical protein
MKLTSSQFEANLILWDRDVPGTKSLQVRLFCDRFVRRADCDDLGPNMASLFRRILSVMLRVYTQGGKSSVVRLTALIISEYHCLGYARVFTRTPQSWHK